MEQPTTKERGSSSNDEPHTEVNVNVDASPTTTTDDESDE